MAGLRRVLELSLVRTALAAVRMRRVALLIHPRARVRVPRAVLQGGGRLTIGRKWGLQRARPSELLADRGARLVVEGKFAIFHGARVGVSAGATLELGSGYANSDLDLDCTHFIRIGHDVAIGDGVVIRDNDYHEIEGAGPRQGAVRIGDHVWIGMQAMILKGVTIGDGAVVAARSVVTRDVPPGMLVAGCPARPIRPVAWRL